MPETKTQFVPLLPLNNGVVLPNMVVTIPLERDEAQAAVAAAREGDRLVLLVPRVEGRYASIGTVARLEDSRKLPNGIEVAILQGLRRATVGSAAAGTGPALRVLAQPAADVNPLSETSHVLAREYKALIENLLELRGANEVVQMVHGIDKPGPLSDLAGYSPDLSLERKVEILETLDVELRLQKLIAWTREILAEASLKDKIRNEVQEGMEKRQREFLLRQQLEAIKKELGESDGDVAGEYRKKIDKVGNDWRGDPSSALLEVLDPAQNHSFRDHYLEVDLDLSEVLFIPTANVADTIPAPLLDRMEIIRLDGYTEEEKLGIGRDHLLRRQLERNGLGGDDVQVDDDALRAIIVDHTREAGVRNLERELGRLLRKLATQIEAGKATLPVRVGKDDVKTYLGRAKFQAEVAERTAVPGVATGLAVTGVGGEVLFVEATAMPGDKGLTLTGQLGDVMKESAQIGLSYVRSHANELGVEPGFEQKAIHVNVPAGAIPKDGPSAGVTMVTALVSLLRGRPVRGNVGMTGEVTLQGNVLPIGG